ncbi:uncharacterized protein DMAD_09713 [Drosophila madeirensis]|uniref:Uncharacterized protein n=1 Tax=Drosophila madeirensis TaxID=30013 RepID=A0AAU9F5Y9_DROMD
MNCMVSLLVGLIVVLIGATNADPAMDEQETPSLVKESDVSAQIMGIDRKYVGRRFTLMPLSDNLTQEERIEYSEACVGISLECHLAEQCCTKMCLQFSKRCTYISPK